MAKRVTQTKPDPTRLILFAVIGVAGLLVVRRYGLAPALKAVNQGLGIARIVRTAGSPTRPARKRPARHVRPKVLGFSNPR